jgi:hypothetical protein
MENYRIEQLGYVVRAQASFITTFTEAELEHWTAVKRDGNPSTHVQVSGSWVIVDKLTGTKLATVGFDIPEPSSGLSRRVDVSHSFDLQATVSVTMTEQHAGGGSVTVQPQSIE